MFDIEQALDELQEMLAEKINAKLDVVQADKDKLGKTIDLKSFDTDNCFFLQTWDDKILNLSPAIFYGVEDIKVIGAGFATGQEVTFFIECVMLDSKMDNLGMKRLLRYSRAIKEVIEENFDFDSLKSPAIIEQMKPLSFRLNNDDGAEIRIGGVNIKLKFI